jgi:hypothetical protein
MIQVFANAIWSAGVPVVTETIGTTTVMLETGERPVLPTLSGSPPGLP